MLHEILWQQNVRLAEACLHHHFVPGLADGTLEPEAFRRYVAQDAFFLNAFARAYALAAARSHEDLSPAERIRHECLDPADRTEYLQRGRGGTVCAGLRPCPTGFRVGGPPTARGKNRRPRYLRNHRGDCSARRPLLFSSGSGPRDDQQAWGPSAA